MSRLQRLSSSTIDDYYLGNRAYGGWYSKNQLPPIKDKFYIINMQDAGGMGTHWVAVINTKPTCIYFDSFGLHPPQDILNFMRGSNKECVMSDVEIQNMKSESCGYYCMAVIDMVQSGIPFVDIVLDKFSFDTLDNERVLSGGRIKFSNPIKAIRKKIKSEIRKYRGIKDRVVGFVKGPRTNAPPSVRKFLKLKGDNNVVGITVCRSPVQSFVQNALNIASLGAWN